MKRDKVINRALSIFFTILSLAWIYPVFMIALNSFKKATVQRLDLHALPVSGHRLHALRHRRHRHPQRLPLVLTWCIGVRFLCTKGVIITTPSFWGLSRRPVGIS